MRPITINFPAISRTAVANAYATAIPANTPFVLNGGSFSNIFTGETSYYYELPAGVAVKPIIRNGTATDYSTAIFTFVGENNYGQPITYQTTGPIANIREMVDEPFHKITSITCDSVVTNVSIGLSANGLIDIPTDTWNKEAQYTLQYSDFVGTDISLTTQYSAVSPTIFTNGIYEYNPNFENSLFSIPLTNTANVFLSPTTDTTFPLTAATSLSIRGVPVSAFRTIVSYATITDDDDGSFNMTFLQQGAKY